MPKGYGTLGISYNLEKHGDLASALAEIIQARRDGAGRLRPESPAEVLRPVIIRWMGEERVRLGMGQTTRAYREPGPPFGANAFRFQSGRPVEYEWSCAKCRKWERGFAGRTAAREAYRSHRCAPVEEAPAVSA